MAYEVVRVVLRSDLNLGQILCAWCLSEQGKPAGEGSHGICKKHKQREWDKYLKSRATRVAGRN